MIDRIHSYLIKQSDAGKNPVLRKILFEKIFGLFNVSSICDRMKLTNISLGHFLFQINSSFYDDQFEQILI